MPSDGGLHVPNARSLRYAPTHPEIRRKKPTATPPKVAGIVPRLETATDGLGDACELAGARGSDSAGAERGCLEPGFAALAENDRTPGGACTDARIGVLTWCRAAFELVEARGPGAGKGSGEQFQRSALARTPPGAT